MVPLVYLPLNISFCIEKCTCFENISLFGKKLGGASFEWRLG